MEEKMGGGENQTYQTVLGGTSGVVGSPGLVLKKIQLYQEGKRKETRYPLHNFEGATAWVVDPSLFETLKIYSAGR